MEQIELEHQSESPFLEASVKPLVSRDLKQKNRHVDDGSLCAQTGGNGVEPLHTDSESAVLPLDEPPLTKTYITTFLRFLTRVLP